MNKVKYVTQYRKKSLVQFEVLLKNKKIQPKQYIDIFFSQGSNNTKQLIKLFLNSFIPSSLNLLYFPSPPHTHRISMDW